MTAKVQFVIDEAGSVGTLPPIEDALDKLRSYGVRLILAYQSMGQLNQCWPEGKAQTLLSNTTQLFVGVSDNTTADYVSARLGAATIEVASSSINSGSSYTEQSRNSTYSSGRGTNWSYQKRELLQPAEVMALPTSMAITLTQGLPPIATKLVRHFDEPGLFTGRGRSLGSSGLLMLRSACFLLLALLTAGMVTEAAQERAQRPPTPNVGQPWGPYGPQPRLDDTTRPSSGIPRW